jgi:heme-degrading monooxygenase HmoA
VQGLLTTFRAQENSAPRLVDAFTRELAPVARAQPGLVRLALFLNEPTLDGLCMSVWQSDASKFAPERVAAFSSQVTEWGATRAVETVAFTRAAGAPTRVAVAQAQVLQGRLDAAVTIARDLLLPQATACGARGIALFVEHATATLISATAWDDEAALEAYARHPELPRMLVPLQRQLREALTARVYAILAVG